MGTLRHLVGNTTCLARSHNQVALAHLTRRCTRTTIATPALHHNQTQAHNRRRHHRLALRTYAHSPQSAAGDLGDSEVESGTFSEVESMLGELMNDVDMLQKETAATAEALLETQNANAALKQGLLQGLARQSQGKLDWELVACTEEPRTLSPEEAEEVLNHNMDLIIRSLDKDVVVRKHNAGGFTSELNLLRVASEEELAEAPALGGGAAEVELTLNAIDKLEFHPLNTVEAVHHDFKRRTSQHILGGLSEQELETHQLKQFHINQAEGEEAQDRSEQRAGRGPDLALIYDDAVAWRRSENDELDVALRRAGRKVVGPVVAEAEAEAEAQEVKSQELGGL
uniref:Uncharacterized protein n=1 Tax=Pyramimonas obovata TaxID=1411642 RepID=A0A7S0RLV0_9CHLO|mmetsp:Transcript_37286/g.81194  ORF Transcript_37286/g.81194 Transcript_37286/m.81194 type:complete len:341 (+) Transcript_37286:344-1366(+)